MANRKAYAAVWTAYPGRVMKLQLHGATVATIRTRTKQVRDQMRTIHTHVETGIEHVSLLELRRDIEERLNIESASEVAYAKC